MRKGAPVTIITIKQQHATPDGFSAMVSFDHTGDYSCTFTSPFDGKAETRLEWYFEQWLRFPFTEGVRANEAAASITAYGEALFDQLFGDRRAYARYSQTRNADVTTLQFEIVGSPTFHALHWEALKDPNLPRPFALDALVTRKPAQPQNLPAQVRDSPTINVLVVTARPHGARDVAYRTISRPLLEVLHQSKVPVTVTLVRPGTYESLSAALEDARQKHGAGYYQIVHFDLHGSLLSYDQFQHYQNQPAPIDDGTAITYRGRFGRGDLAAYTGEKAFLFLETSTVGTADPVAAEEVAALLTTHQVPIVLLNACQSAKQGSHADAETSLGARLMEAGVQLVLAMRYSVTVSAATLLMRTLYAQLAEGSDLQAAIRRARQALSNDKARRAYFNHEIALEDWLLPVVYQYQPVAVRPRPFTTAEANAFYARQSSYAALPMPTYGFIGRDLDILALERLLLQRNNIVLVRGMGGAGKTTLLQHLQAWWAQTELIDQSFSIAYDQHAWTVSQIVQTIARQLYGEAAYQATFALLVPQAQQQRLVADLRASRHLLVLDNLESITGSHLAIQHMLPPAEREALRSFLRTLRGGKTLVLLGSRSGESWLAPETFDTHAYHLAGLDGEAASQLADAVLERHGVTVYRSDASVPTHGDRAAQDTRRDFERLLRLLAGYPLAIQVVLANLAHQTPAAVLAALAAGDVDLDSTDAETKTTSIVKCIDYSHTNLSPAAQTLLLCLAPFVGVLFVPNFESYIAQLQQQPLLAALPFAQWDAVLGEAQDWGLLAPHPQLGEQVLTIQPTLPYFLSSRLQREPKLRTVIDAAFVAHYRQVGEAFATFADSKQADERQRGLAMLGLEYENLYAALERALQALGSIIDLHRPLSMYLDAQQDHQRGLQLGEQVLALQYYPEAVQQGPLGVEFASIVDDIGKRQLLCQQYGAAAASYQRALALWQRNTHYLADQIKQGSASTYHQLGRVAQEQREWAAAKAYYTEALAIYEQFDDRYSQARTYHQLGMVAQEQREWAAAREYFLTALESFVAYSDLHTAGVVFGSLTRLWRASNDATLPAAVAALLGTTAAEVEQGFRQAFEGEEG